METIVERIRRVCQDLHISIMKMEKDLGFGNGFLNPKKIKTVSADRLFMIADYLNVSAEYLARGVESDGASPRELAMMQKIRALDEHGRKIISNDVKYAPRRKKCCKKCCQKKRRAIALLSLC